MVLHRGPIRPSVWSCRVSRDRTGVSPVRRDVTSDVWCRPRIRVFSSKKRGGFDPTFFLSFRREDQIMNLLCPRILTIILT